MKHRLPAKTLLFATLLLCAFILTSCAQKTGYNGISAADVPDAAQYLRFVDDEPDTVDFQCTTLYYTVALNVFDRLVDTETGPDGNARIVPALAENWQVSGDGLTYTFQLRKGVAFSNGDPLTAEDVHFTLVRLLTHPDSRNREIAASIAGAEALTRGAADDLEGFTVLADDAFSSRL